MKNIGIFAANFDPITIDHINFLNEVKKEFKLNEIFLVITQRKEDFSPYVPIKAKKEMCKLAIKEIIFLKLFEEDSLKENYNISQILQEIKNKNENCKMFFIVPSSILNFLEKIYDIDNITKIAKIVSIISPKKYAILEKKLNFIAEKEIELKLKNIKPIQTKKTRILLATDNNCCENVINPLVLQYIKKNNLYIGKEQLFLECLNACKQNTSKKRFTHCTFVAKAAKDLAKIYGEDEIDAQIAGILHDIMKEKSKEYMLKLFKTYKTKLTDAQKINPKVWHGIAGAVYMKNILGIENEKIINAVKYHTVPRKEMSTFEKIIFMADRISKDRKYKDVKFLRTLTQKNLDGAVIYSLSNTITSLVKKKSTISTPTVECYNSLIIKKFENTNQ